MKYLSSTLLTLIVLVCLGVSPCEAQNCSPGVDAIRRAYSAPPCNLCNQNMARFTYGIDSLEIGLYDYTLEPSDSTQVYHEQWLDLYSPFDLTDSLIPNSAPVFIYSHSEGQTAADLQSKGNYFQSHGLNFIAWESAQLSSTYIDEGSIEDYDLFELGKADLQLVLDWVYTHKDDYGFDIDNVVIGGSSRGTALSFFGLDRDNPRVSGIFMSQAFPDGQSIFPQFAATEACPIDFISAAVTPNYPPVVLRYEHNKGVTINSHDPLNGLEIMEAYERLAPNTPVRLTYDHGDSISWHDEALAFITDQAAYFSAHPEREFDADLDTTPESELLAVLEPLDLHVSSNAEDSLSDVFRIKWSKSNWSDSLFVTHPSVISCELRMGRLDSLEDSSIADNALNAFVVRNYSFTDLDEYSYPEEGYMSPCELKQYIDTYSEGNEIDSLYAVQVRCNIPTDDTVRPKRKAKYWTAYTELMPLLLRCEANSVDTLVNDSLYFNPLVLNDSLTIHSNLTDVGQLFLTLYRHDGKKILRKETTVAEGLNNTFPLAALPPGNYTIQILWYEGDVTVEFSK